MLGATFRGHTCDFADGAAVYGLIDELKDHPPARHPRQQRRHHQAKPAAEHRDDDWIESST